MFITGGGRRMCCVLIHEHIVLILVMKVSGAKGTPETIYLAYQMGSDTPISEGLGMVEPGIISLYLAF